jgi:hypothetical protein
MYAHYKPFRNFLAKQHLFAALTVVWQHAKRHSRSEHQRNLLDPSHNPLVWELELLVREIVLNGVLVGSGNEMSDMGLKAYRYTQVP